MKARIRVSGRRRRAVSTLAAGAVVALLPSPAAASPFPAQHFALMRVDGEPLRTGFVEVIHPEGPEVYARHVYQVNGARPDASYDVVIRIWTSSLTCVDDPQFVLPVAVVTTNASGNGQADAAHDPELLAALGLRGRTIGGEVTLLRERSPAYTTGCKVIELD